MHLVIFGAQAIALSTYEALKELYPRRSVHCFIVTSKQGNPSTLAGLPVRELAEYSSALSAREKADTEVLIATPENVQMEIEESLEHHGFFNHQRITAEQWAELIKLFHTRIGKFLPISALPIGSQNSFIRVFVAMSHHDKPLREAWRAPEWMLAVQAGAAMTQQKVASLCDDQGENISARNGNYSELTVLYWMWKNRLMPSQPENEQHQYYGLAQYRRFLNISPEDVSRLASNSVDVVLPYPMLYEPNISVHHQRYLKEEDWQALLSALHKLHPEYDKAMSDILGQPYFYNYNIILAKKAILREYCNWLFPILEKAGELSIPQEKDRADRYLGYMAETLETLYFLTHAKQYNIVHTNCRFLV